MLMNRVVGALTFKRQVYADVEKDTSFTGTAWAIVAISALLGGLGSYALAASGAVDTGATVVSAVLGIVLALVSFAVGAFAVAWIGKALFKADVSFDEMVRTLGLANIWGLLSVVLLLGLLAPALLCVTGFLGLVIAVLSFISYLIAVKEALDLDWGPTIITVVGGWVVSFIINVVVGGIIGVGAGLAGALGG